MKRAKQPLMVLSDDRIEIRSVVGRGRNSVVYRGFDYERELEVAIKVTDQNTGVARHFSSIEQPFIVPILETQRSRDVERTVRPYIEGTNLEKLLINLKPLGVRDRERLTGRELLSFLGHSAGRDGFSAIQAGDQAELLAELNFPEAVALLGFQLANALSAAHEKGFIHQNLKATNILIGLSGNAFLTDFMSPEGIFPAIEGIYEKADRFSLISLLWELVDGRLLRASSVTTILRTEPEGSLSAGLLRFLQPEYFKQGTALELSEVLWDFVNRRPSEFSQETVAL